MNDGNLGIVPRKPKPKDPPTPKVPVPALGADSIVSRCLSKMEVRSSALGTLGRGSLVFSLSFFASEVVVGAVEVLLPEVAAAEAL